MTLDEAASRAAFDVVERMGDDKELEALTGGIIQTLSAAGYSGLTPRIKDAFELLLFNQEKLGFYLSDGAEGVAHLDASEENATGEEDVKEDTK